MTRNERVIKKYKEIVLWLLTNTTLDITADRNKYAQLESELSAIESEEVDIEALSGEKIDDIKIITSTDYPEEAQREELTTDLQQYMTNLLYTARDSGRDVNDIEFDAWVESQINGISDYLKAK